MVFLPKIMYKVKITTGKNSDGLLAQTPGSKGISKCGKYQFFIDEEVEDPDFWIVRNKYIKSKTASFVAPQNVILMISEPVSIVSFPKAYLKQFGLICSCQEEIRDIENVVYTPATLPWLVGVTTQNGVPKHSISYDYLKQSAPPKKTKLIDRGLEIRYCEDLKSYKKLIPSLALFPEALIVTVDDDIIYPDVFLENLINAHKENPSYILCYRARQFSFNWMGKLRPYMKWKIASHKQAAALSILPNGIGGILYYPGCFDKQVRSQRTKRLDLLSRHQEIKRQYP